MKSIETLQFTVDKENRTVHVSKEFSAPKDLVWSAWTEKELLDQWWAPKPWKSVTRQMEFKVGGIRTYAMVGPNGEEHWALAKYTSISPKTNFKFLDAFCDSQGNVSREMPRSNWNVNFVDNNESTEVKIEIRHKKLEDLEKLIEMGFKEGFTMALGHLEEVLEKR